MLRLGMEKGARRLEQMERLLGLEVTRGNAIEILVNGDEIFPAMLEAIRSAEKTIHFLTYVYWRGRIAEEFANAIALKAAQGVECYVLLDALGAGPMDRTLIETMTNAGAQVVFYNRVTFRNFLHYYQRTHRKILVVDRIVGFNGGVGIADEWLGDAQNEDEWHEFHFRVTGPAVAQIFNAFAENWNEVDTCENPFPFLDGSEEIELPIRPIADSDDCSGAFEDQDMQCFYSSPREGHFESYELYKSAIESAKSRIYIENAYFIPNAEMLELLSAADERGVEVKVILPDFHNDSWIARCRSRAIWGELLQRGVELYRYKPSMTHSKFMIVDDDWVTAGSVNFDTISFKVNEESNLNIFGKEFAGRMTELFEFDLSRSRKISMEEWTGRSVFQRLEEMAAKAVPVPA